MKLSDYDYQLPVELIAQEPPVRREDSRLMVVDRSDRCIEHLKFHQITDLLHAGDLLILNNTRVLPARIFGIRHTGGRVEALLVQEDPPGTWQALLKCRGHLEDGETIQFHGVSAKLLGKHPTEGWLLQMDADSESLRSTLEISGLMPLPPYIKRERGGDERAGMDKERYQTVFAETPGAIAAPTAGLHFSKTLMEKLKAKGVLIEYVTLHVGLGTFKPVTTDDPREHVMHFEEYSLSEQTAVAVNTARTERRRVIPVGTTSTRTLEACAHEGQVTAGHGSTDLFIYPPYEFQVVDSLITNFHLPKSTLLLLVSALADREFILEAYQTAVAEGYRFFSYGDAMFIV